MCLKSPQIVLKINKKSTQQYRLTLIRSHIVVKIFVFTNRQHRHWRFYNTNDSQIPSKCCEVRIYFGV